MKILHLLLLTLALPLALLGNAQQNIQITILDAQKKAPLEGASVFYKDVYYKTDSEGKVMLKKGAVTDIILVTFTGYLEKEIYFDDLQMNPTVLLSAEDKLLQEVIVSTGYYTASKERTTGAFTVIDEKLLNRSLGSDLISKLDGVTSSLQVDKRFDVVEGPKREDNIRIRGVSTIHSDSKPLIVLNNFPFEGDLDLINPDDIESITISKDAAAASIWGARAGNGVIVITTKKGKQEDKPQVSFNTTVILGEKPDLFYSPRFLSSKETVGLERKMFGKGYYVENEFSPLSPVVEMLIDEREGRITSEKLELNLQELYLRDVREDALKHLYRNSVKQRYGLNIRGGGEFYKYYLAAGYDKSNENLVRDRSNKINISTDNNFKLSKNLTFNTSLSFAQHREMDNGMGLHTFTSANRSSHYPYMKFKEGENNLPLITQYRKSYILEAENKGMRNWEFFPLDEIEINDNITSSRFLNLNSQLNWEVMKGLDWGIFYNYQLYGKQTQRLHNADSYFVRDLVNRFTQDDMNRVFPEGAVLWKDGDENNVHSGRTQLAYGNVFNIKHSINAIAGAEIRQTKMTSGPAVQLPGYDERSLNHNASLDYNTRFRTQPYGFTSTLPVSTWQLEGLTDRYVSYYTNAAYGYDDRLFFSLSARWDASNLFGVNTNQKGVPLWSVGGKWHIHKETFFDNSIFSTLSFRATYGYNGNVNKSATAYPTVNYTYDNAINLNSARLMGPGNPNLRWEKTATTNLGLDFSIINNAVTGIIDLYRKKSADILGNDIMDPTTGISTYGGSNLTYLVNYADMLTRGFDIELTSRNLKGKVSWLSSVIFNYTRNEITKYNSNESSSIIPYFQNRIAPPVEGVTRDALYSLPWYGLSSENGYQNVKLDGEESQNYSAYMNQVKYDDLIFNGSSIAPYFGSLRNVIEIGSYDFSFNLQWKFGYHFRRSSIIYSHLFDQLSGHRDYNRRWMTSGDESSTNIPAIPEKKVSFQDEAYRYSEVLIEKGDHIRLQDIQAGYRLNSRNAKGPFSTIYFHLYVRNIGIIWKANKQGIDPDFPESAYPPVRTYGLGMKLHF